MKYKEVITELLRPLRFSLLLTNIKTAFDAQIILNATQIFLKRDTHSDPNLADLNQSTLSSLSFQ